MSDYIVRGAILSGFDEAVRERRGDTQALLNKVGLCIEDLEDPSYYFAYDKYVRLLNLAAEVLQFPFFGHLLSEKKGVTQLGILGRIVATSATPFEALQALINYQHLQSHSAVSTMRLERNGLQWVHNIHFSCNEPLFQAYLNIIGVGINVARLLGGRKVNPIVCYSTFDKPADDHYLRCAYRCAIQYNADFNGCVFPAADLMTPFNEKNPAVNQRLQLRAQSLLQATPHLFALQVKDMIRQAIAIGCPTIAWLAAQLGKNKRTLQRELDAHNLTFKVLLDDVRLEVAKHHLEYSALSLTQIADVLGYSDLSAFSRFFSKHCQMSPLHWRKQHLQITVD